MSLRRTLTLALLVVVAVVGSAAVGLFALTTHLRVALTDLREVARSVRVSQGLETDLVMLSRTRDGHKRTTLEESIRGGLSTLEGFADSWAHWNALRDVEGRVGTYLASLAGRDEGRDGPGGSASERLDGELDAAATSLERLSDLSIADAERVEARAERAASDATYLAVTIGAVLILGVGAVILWLRGAVFQPVVALGQVVARYGDGDRGVRAPQGGADEIRQIANRFNQMAASMERQRESQLAFLGGVAHDLRTPLSVLRMSSVIGRSERPLPPEPRVRKVLEMVGRQVDRLDRLVGDLLDATRLEAGHFDLLLEPHDLRELAREVVDLFEFEQARHELKLTLPPEAVIVECDPSRISQVLTNLLSNAIKYSPNGGRIDLSVESSETQARIVVADEGMGIPPEVRDELFEPFRRLVEHADTAPGVGLGLFVSRRIAEIHGGRIEVESVPGCGSTFRLQLPRPRRLE